MNTLPDIASLASDTTGTNLAALSSIIYNGTFAYVASPASSSDNGVPGWVNTKPPTSYSSPFTSIASNSTGQNLVAVGSGTVYTLNLNNNNLTWSTQLSVGGEFSSVASDSSGQNLIVVSSGGSVYTSSNGGSSSSWTQVSTSALPQYNWTSVASDSTGQNLIVVSGNGGYVYTSSKGGSSWTQVSTSALPQYYWTSVASDSTGQNLIICGNYTSSASSTSYYIYTSNDGGSSWNNTNPPNLNWNNVASNSSGKILFATASNVGGVYTLQPGSSWTGINATLSKNCTAIACNGAGTQFVVAASGTVYTYSNVQSDNTLSLPGGRITARQTDTKTLTWTHDTTGTSGTIDMTGPYKLTNLNPSPTSVLTYSLSSSMTITSANSYIIIGSDYITIDGGNTTGKRVIFNSVQSYPGLIQNGSINLDTLITTPSYSNITVQNITTYDYNNTSTLVEYGGWVCQPSFGSITDNINYTSNVTVTNCTNNCTITSFGCGGIVGSGFCGSGSSPNTNIIKNCINNGTITGTYSGGITGTGFCSDGPYLNSFATIQACSNTGNVNSNSSGGIIGAYSSGIISNCTNTGPVIINSIAGGIIGNNNTPGEQCTIENCYTLHGLIAGATTNVSISNNCYVANGSWSSTDAASFLTLPNTDNPPPPYYWLYNTTATTTISTTPFLIASLYQNNKNYVTSTTQFTTATTSSQTPLPVGLRPVTLALPVTVTKSSKSKAKTSTTGTSYATTNKIEASSQNADIGDSVFMVTPDNSSYQVAGSITGYGSIYVSRTLQYTFPTGSMVYIYPAGTSDADIYADQNLPIPIADICFLRNTPIETDQGIIPIHKIDPSLHTINNKKIITITKSVTEDKFLICFEKHSLGENIPSARTIVSKYHKIQNRKGKMMDAYKFLDYYEDVKKVDYDGEILYNILMEDHETVNVNNLVCETLHPDHEIAKLYKNNYSDEYTDTVIAFMNYSKKVSSTFRKG
jgi:hypothetical protein